MLHELSHLILQITREYFVIGFISVGYLTWRKDAFSRALFILLFTMLLNPYLKSIFQIPLDPALGKQGWAFPSGHMQTTFALWMWLGWELRNRLFSLIVACVVLGVAFALVYEGYHTPKDIMGAVGFGFATLLLYAAVCRITPQDKHPYLGVFMAAIGLFLIFLTPENLPHMWIAEGALVGFSIGWAIYHAWDTDDWLFKRRYTVAAAFAGIVALYIVTIPLKGYMGLEGLNFVRFSAIAFWVSHGAEAAVFYLHRITGRL